MKLAIINFKHILLGSLGKLVILLVSTSLLSACGITQSVSDGTSSTFERIFYKKVKVVHLDITAREAANLDASGASLSTMVRVYQLSNIRSFKSIDYSDLLANGSQVLSSELLAQNDVYLRPGEAHSLSVPLEKNAEFIGIAAMFVTPNLVDNTWRIIIPKSELHPDKPRYLTLTNQELILRGLKE